MLDADGSDTLYVSFYRCEQGMLKHYIKNDMHGSSYASAVTVGEQQSYMKSNQVYYSYDGHYFYTDYNTMLDDYKADTRKHAINPDDPYYNYYQFVSNRTKTSFTANDIDQYVKHYLGSQLHRFRHEAVSDGPLFYPEPRSIRRQCACALWRIGQRERLWHEQHRDEQEQSVRPQWRSMPTRDMANGYQQSPRTASRTMREYYVNLWYSTPKYSTYHGSFLGDKSPAACSAMPPTHTGGRRRRTGPGQLDDLYISGKSDVGRETISGQGAGGGQCPKRGHRPPRPCLYTTPARAETCPSSCWMR